MEYLVGNQLAKKYLIDIDNLIPKKMKFDLLIDNL